MQEQKIQEIRSYGVVLKRLTHDKIEMVRCWRNHPKISRYMEYRDEITPEMQEKWFASIDNDRNYYFLIVVEGVEIGLINIRDIDYDKKEGEGGIFIWDDKYLNGTTSYRASLCLGDFGFERLGLKKIVGHVLKDNKRAQKYNISLGYKISPDQEAQNNQEYTLTYEDHKTKRQLIKKLLK